MKPRKEDGPGKNITDRVLGKIEAPVRSSYIVMGKSEAQMDPRKATWQERKSTIIISLGRYVVIIQTKLIGIKTVASFP